MALIACPECAREISDRAPSCPHCGVPVGTGSRVTASGLLIAFVLVGAVLYAIPAIRYGSAGPCGMIRNAFMREMMAEPAYQEAAPWEQALIAGVGVPWIDRMLEAKGPVECGRMLIRYWQTGLPTSTTALP